MGGGSMECTEKLVVAVSSRALFDLDESHRIFETHGEEKYAAYQAAHEQVPLEPGVAFKLVRKLLSLNARCATDVVEVILLSRNSSDTGLRVFNSIAHHGLAIQRAAFTRGQSPYRYASAFGAQLFLSTNPEDVKLALDAGVASAIVMQSVTDGDDDRMLRIAFDGDAVIFSDEAEQVFAERGLGEFMRSEAAAREVPLCGGPFKPLLAALHRIQSLFPPGDSAIRTALITARCAPAHERVIRTLRSWDIRIDEALFLGGLDKGLFLKGFGADIFFDDQQRNCESAASYVAAGHVPYGVKNSESYARRRPEPQTEPMPAAG